MLVGINICKRKNQLIWFIFFSSEKKGNLCSKVYEKERKICYQRYEIGIFAIILRKYLCLHLCLYTISLRFSIKICWRKQLLISRNISLCIIEIGGVFPTQCIKKRIPVHKKWIKWRETKKELNEKCNTNIALKT